MISFIPVEVNKDRFDDMVDEEYRSIAVAKVKKLVSRRIDD